MERPSPVPPRWRALSPRLLEWQEDRGRLDLADADAGVLDLEAQRAWPSSALVEVARSVTRPRSV
jgi:hypothetical protein